MSKQYRLVREILHRFPDTSEISFDLTPDVTWRPVCHRRGIKSKHVARRSFAKIARKYKVEKETALILTAFNETEKRIRFVRKTSFEIIPSS